MSPGSSSTVSSVLSGDLEAERRVLGILIKHPALVDSVMDRLRPDFFVDPAHRAIYQIILDLYQRQGRISYTQIYNRLRQDGSIPAPDEVLLDLTQAFATTAELEPSVEALAEAYGRRRIYLAAEEIQKAILSGEYDNLSQLQARAQELIFEATQTDVGESDVKDLLQVLEKCYTRLVERREGKRTSGLYVRYPSIDYLTTGFKNKDLIILAARPSMGKTSLVLNFCVNVARRGITVLIFSLEMDDEQIGDRLVISELFRFQERSGGAPVTAQDYARGMTDEQFACTQEVFNELYQLPIKIVDRRGLTTAEIRAKARKVKAENPNLGLIVIDYLQLIRPPAGVNKNWTLVVGDIVREIRDLAGELDLPIILLSQLNRSVETRDNKRPVMSDLRDSGNIEEFADVIMFLYRDDYYYPERAAENGTEGLVEVIVAKQRKGPTGTAYLRFIKEYTRFIDESDREV